MLADGAAIKDMPVDIMRARNNAGKIYACDVGAGGMKTHFYIPLNLYNQVGHYFLEETR